MNSLGTNEGAIGESFNPNAGEIAVKTVFQIYISRWDDRYNQVSWSTLAHADTLEAAILRGTEGALHLLSIGRTQCQYEINEVCETCMGSGDVKVKATKGVYVDRPCKSCRKSGPIVRKIGPIVLDYLNGHSGIKISNT